MSELTRTAAASLAKVAPGYVDPGTGLFTAAALLGLPAEKDWVLLANHIDKSLLRNDLSLCMGRLLGLDFTRWPILDQTVAVNHVIHGGTHAGEVSFLQSWLNDRATWLDGAFRAEFPARPGNREARTGTRAGIIRPSSGAGPVIVRVTGPAAPAAGDRSPINPRRCSPCG
ncbi:MAG: hypothetical protein QM674_07460 [Burkholderiaceae bacterium]